MRKQRSLSDQKEWDSKAKITVQENERGFCRSFRNSELSLRERFEKQRKSFLRSPKNIHNGNHQNTRECKSLEQTLVQRPKGKMQSEVQFGERFFSGGD